MRTEERQFRRLTRKTRVGLIVALAVLSVAALFFAPPVPLGAGYHDFSDKRNLLRIANGLDVLSNIPFMAVGIWGVAWLLRPSSRGRFVTSAERIPYLIFFGGVGLTGFGSFWYHLAPGNARLPWDLVPMTCSFMSLLAAIIMERISVKAGLRCLPPLLALGVASVAYWYVTEQRGHGDYRFYLFVQFFPPVLIAAILALFRPRYTGIGYLAIAFLSFVLAKMFELFDKQIYAFSRMVSGHSLKHVTAGIACYWILMMLQRRRAVADFDRDQTRRSQLAYQRQTAG